MSPVLVNPLKFGFMSAPFKDSWQPDPVTHGPAIPTCALDYEPLYPQLPPAESDS
ncbi:MAG: hypothetical protein ACLQM6_11440 [Acidobacteriaceae bacterium]